MTSRAALRHAIEALYHAGQDMAWDTRDAEAVWREELDWHMMRQAMLGHFVVHLWGRLDAEDRDSPEGRAVVPCEEGGYLIDFVSLGMEVRWQNGTTQTLESGWGGTPRRPAPGRGRRVGRGAGGGTGGAAAARP